MGRDAAQAWAEMLDGWAIPAELVEAAPATPYFFDPAVFTAAADEAVARADDTVSDAVARAALPSGGAVLDVGSGAGAASLRLGAARVTAVDPNGELLAAFAQRARTLGAEPVTIEGRWPDVAPVTPEADVVVCHHVVYNVGELDAFAVALTEHASRRVVVELTAVHPLSWMAPYWRAMHGITQPERPVAADAIAVLEELGLDVHEQRWTRRMQMIGEAAEAQVARIARRLCLPDSRHDEVAQLLREIPPPEERDVVTLWFSP